MRGRKFFLSWTHATRADPHDVVPRGCPDRKTRAPLRGVISADAVLCQDNTVFMAQRVLIAVCAEIPFVRTEEYDLESLFWVILCAVYKHGLEDAAILEHVPIDGFREKLADEYRMLFGAHSIEDLRSMRTAAYEAYAPLDDDWRFSDVRAGVANLLAYAQQVDRTDPDLDGDLNGILGVIWELILQFRPRQVYIPKEGDSVSTEYRIIAFGKKEVADEVSSQKVTHDRVLEILHIALAFISTSRIERQRQKVQEKYNAH